MNSQVVHQPSGIRRIWFGVSLLSPLVQDRAGWLKLATKVLFAIGKPQLRPPRCDTRVTPEEKRGRFWLACIACAYTSARGIGFCVIWDCTSSSSSLHFGLSIAMATHSSNSLEIPLLASAFPSILKKTWVLRYYLSLRYVEPLNLLPLRTLPIDNLSFGFRFEEFWRQSLRRCASCDQSVKKYWSICTN